MISILSTNHTYDELSNENEYSNNEERTSGSSAPTGRESSEDVGYNQKYQTLAQLLEVVSIVCCIGAAVLSVLEISERCNAKRSDIREHLNTAVITLDITSVCVLGIAALSFWSDKTFIPYFFCCRLNDEATTTIIKVCLVISMCLTAASMGLAGVELAYKCKEGITNLQDRDKLNIGAFLCNLTSFALSFGSIFCYQKV